MYYLSLSDNFQATAFLSVFFFVDWPPRLPGALCETEIVAKTQHEKPA